ncbi:MULTISPECIES: hypothetical protein [unclassified Sphingobium]|nr:MULTISPECIES: hypothetical protein [unclassified Sphingobium]MBG6117703.1 hypothetical protein [Sphingobium sp. JAI105]
MIHLIVAATYSDQPGHLLQTVPTFTAQPLTTPSLLSATGGAGKEF